ncbi:interleukin-11 receptor subunit alpha isoform X2 [Oryzias melastigma]|uniref:interleukin-11 receptor subunit alpha isoform X2 n=1 Tax=Oryzias melastigma TaxID=30732 RepID=UPI00168D50F9|nr:interleukin-11 receptor subunit alpha isoform X2 [Oryzias melastigma]
MKQMHGLLSSPVCLTVIWFLSWSLRSSCAQIWNGEVSGLQYGRLGSNITLACGKSQHRTSVMWLHNQKEELPWHKVTSDGKLVLLQASQSAQGNYSCHSDEGSHLHSISLMLGHPPEQLNVICRMPNHSYIHCSWVESVNTLLPAKYNASFRGSHEDWKPCVVDASQKHCEVILPAFWQVYHILAVTQTNALGSHTTLDRIKLDKLLKPDPPELLRVEQLEGFPRRLNVSWSYPSSWARLDAYPLHFQINYRPQGSKYWSQAVIWDTSVVLYDALEGYVHEVQVRAQDQVNSDSQWSEWTNLILAKPWEAESKEDEDSEEMEVTENYDIVSSYTEFEPSHNFEPQDDGDLGLMILLICFSVLILTTVLSLILVMWMRRRRRNHDTKQGPSSMVKMKSMPI